MYTWLVSIFIYMIFFTSLKTGAAKRPELITWESRLLHFFNSGQLDGFRTCS